MSSLFQEKGKNEWTTGRANANDVDLNRNFPDLNSKMYHNEETHKGRNNHLLKLEKAIKMEGDKVRFFHYLHFISNVFLFFFVYLIDLTKSSKIGESMNDSYHMRLTWYKLNLT